MITNRKDLPRRKGIQLWKGLLKILLAAFIFLNIMLMFQAYKLTHYYDSPGTAMSAPAIPTGWGKIHALLFGINSFKQINIVPDSSYKTVYLKTANGLRLEAWFIAAPAAKGTVALFHGHGGNKSGVIREAEAFRSMGYNTFLLDFRAHGGSDGHSSTIGYKESEDVRLAYDYLRQQGEKNIIFWGISLGAAAITKAVADYHIAPQKIILEMPFGTLHDAVKGRVQMAGLPAQPISALLTFWGGAEQGFWAFRMQPEEFVKAIQCPVLLQWGRLDNRVSKNETAAIFANIPGDKQLVVYDSCGHESLCACEHAKWLSNVQAFLAK